MHQPLSIYLRSARLDIGRLHQRAIGKAARLAVSAKLVPAARGSRVVARAPRRVVTLGEIDRALDELGIRRGDKVIVHSGISNLGKLREGVPALLAGLRDRIGAQGLLLFPAFPFGSLMHTWLQQGPAFDAASSPTLMGTLAELALRESDRVRSVHPTHSVCGFGARARAFLDGHHLDTTAFGPNSPFWRLAESGGKIITLGVGMNSVTGFHLTEDRMGDAFPVRVYLDTPYEVTCRDDEGQVHRVRVRCHDPFLSRLRDGELAEAHLLHSGVHRRIAVGDHRVGVIDCAGLDRELQWLARERRLTVYGRLWG